MEINLKINLEDFEPLFIKTKDEGGIPCSCCLKESMFLFVKTERINREGIHSTNLEEICYRCLIKNVEVRINEN